MSPATWHREGESYVTCSPQPCAQAHQHYIFKWEPVGGFQTTDDAADFASLLEREPEQVGNAEYWEERARAVHRSLDYERRLLDLAKKTSESQAARIKSLEDVLVAIRAGIQASVLMQPTGIKGLMSKANAKLADVTALINETLDPCKPWCCLREGHDGACMQAEDLADGE